MQSIRSVVSSLSHAALACALTTAASFAQDEELVDPAELKVTPEELELEVGETAKLTAEVFDEDGGNLDMEVVFYSRARRSVSVDSDGIVTAIAPGSFYLIARTASREVKRITKRVPVTVAYPALDRIEFQGAPDRLYSGTRVAFDARVLDVLDGERDDIPVELTISDPAVATVDPFGIVSAVSKGEAVLRASAEGLTAEMKIAVLENPVKSIEFGEVPMEARTGDVVRFGAQGLDAGGKDCGVPLHYSFTAQPDDDLGPPASGQIEQDGRFVAEQPGLYTIVVSCGGATAARTLKVTPRDVQREIRLVGRGSVTDVHTSDLWVWEGVDGKDYAVTGTWGANGEAIFWDVTDPSEIERIATVTVDARTVNDVKVSEDGTICIISREGASNRRNGIVIIAVDDPHNPEILSTYDDGLTGGVHNLFIYEDHVYALSAGRRYDIISIEDPKNPERVGSFELESPGHSIHDVWVENGLAYSSNWGDGVHIVDVGNGVAGGTPENPVPVGDYQYPSGWNHAAFPRFDEKTGKFYVIAGDEAFPYGLHVKNTPTYPRGWFHFVDFTDMENPKEVARYQVPEAGTHNLWVEGDLLYGAYYNGGLRVVDISGELMGDLYRQGREVGWFLPTDPDGYVPNASMVWGPQPYKGRIFFSDWNSGLWVVEIPQDDVR